jgi:hypothetical protein
VAGWTVLLGGALATAPFFTASLTFALVVPGAAIVMAVCTRYPVPICVGAFFLTAAYGSVGAFTPVPAGQVADLLLVGLWLSLIWTYLLHGRDRLVWVFPGAVAVGLYVALSAAEIVTATSISSGFYAFRDTGWYIMSFLLLGYAVWRPDTRLKIAKGVLLSVAVIGLYACYRYLAGPAPKEYAQASHADPTNFLNGQFRLVGSFVSAKALAAWCAITVPFAVAMGLTLSGRWRLVALVGAVTCTVALLGTEVRTGVLGLGTGVAVVILLQQAARAFTGLRLGVTITAFFAALLVAAGVFAFTSSKSSEGTSRYTVILTPTRDPAFQARLLRWRTVLADIDTHPFGQGLGSGGRIQREHGRFANISAYDIDNSYLEIAFEQGMGVMILFIAASLVLLAGLVRKAVVTQDRVKAGIAIGACGALWSYLTVLPTGSYFEGLASLAAWMLVGLGIGQFSSPEDATAAAHGQRGNAPSASGANAR